MKKSFFEISKLIIFIIISILIIYFYIKISNYYYLVTNINFQDLKRLEIPLILITLLLIYFPSKKHYFRTIFTLIVSFILLLVMFDGFYSFLTRSPQLSDFSNIFNIIKFDFLLSFVVFLTILFIVYSLILNIKTTYKEYLKKTFIKFILFKLFLILGIVFFINTNNFKKYLTNNFKYIHWSQTRTIQENGRLSSFFYYSYISYKAQKKLENYKNKPIDVNTLLFKNQKINHKKNIYIIILESFIDPRLLENVSFNKSPIHPNLIKYLYKKDFSHINSSVYGGDTAQAEFEILTGIKAYRKVNSIEFNILEGKPISGFISYLKNNDYSTIAISAANAGYFNAKTAYKSIGFDKTIFMDENKAYKGNTNIFDNELFNYSLDYLKNNLIKEPYIMYQLGMYGHHPYKRNYKLRPNIIEVKNANKKILRIANQIYYRTEALSLFIDKLLKYDNKSIILVSSDHLPPILSKEVKYKLNRHQNIAFLLIDGIPVDINGSHQFQMPHLILEYLSNNKNNSKNNKNMLDLYFKALSESQ